MSMISDGTKQKWQMYVPQVVSNYQAILIKNRFHTVGYIKLTQYNQDDWIQPTILIF